MVSLIKTLEGSKVRLWEDGYAFLTRPPKHSC